jgi:hypothetical protein
MTGTYDSTTAAVQIQAGLIPFNAKSMDAQLLQGMI